MTGKLRMRSLAAVGGMTLLLLGAGRSAAQAQAPGARPAEVTDSAVARGVEIFHGVGGCFKCHGIEGGGTPTGTALRQGVWLHGPDTYQAIVARVVHGIPRDESLRDTGMVARGGQALSRDQVLAVAAYVWWLSHPGKNGGGRPSN